MRRVFLLVIAAAALLFGRAAVAHAGYGIQPAAGSTTSPTPTFLVYLDNNDSDAIVYVASSPDMTDSGFPLQEVGSCLPTTPFSEADKYSCAPSYYSPSFTSSLAPGTYYWWMSFLRQDPGQLFATVHTSGPFQFTVAQPTAPTGVTLVSPADTATVSATPRLQIQAPASAQLNFYVSTDSERNDDGSPLVGADASCTGTTSSSGGLYYCDVPQGALIEGETYYWWVVVTVNGGSFVYGPRSFTVQSSEPPPPPSTGSTGGGAGGNTAPPPSPPPARQVTDAPSLPSSAHYRGESIRQTKLAAAAYTLSKILHAPKQVDVACWSVRDWANISGDNPESAYTTLGFFYPRMPHWLELSPEICRSMETLTYHRPRYANRITADGVDTLTHEMLHALGLRNEAETECLAMQLNWLTAIALGVPQSYAMNLSRLSLDNYDTHPPKYIDHQRCREGGAWDINPTKPSLPWHFPGV